MAKAPDRAPGMVALTVAALLWGGTIVPAKWILSFVSPITLAAARFTLAALVLLPWALWTHHRARGFAGMRWGRLAIQGLLGVSLYYALGYWGLQLSSGAHSSMISASLPLMTAVISGLVLREAISARQWVGGGVAALGVAAILLGSSDLAESGSVRGDLLIISTNVFWGLYTALTKRWGDDLPSLVMTAWVMSFGTLFLWIISAGALFLLPANLPQLRPAELAVLVTPRGALSVAYLGLGASALAYLLWNRVIVAVPTSYSSLFLNLLPVVGLALSVLVLGETVSWLAVGGGVVSVAAVFLTAWKSKE